MSDQSAIDAAFDALGDPQRREIIRQLRRGPRPVGLIADGLTIGRPAVSKHLRVLQGAGLVERTSVGTRNLYSLAPAALAPLQQWLAQQWDDVLKSFADHVTSTITRRDVPVHTRSQEP